MAVMGNQYKPTNPFKETIDLVSSICLDGWFSDKYPECPASKLKSPSAILRRRSARALTGMPGARAHRPMRCLRASICWMVITSPSKIRSMPSILLKKLNSSRLTLSSISATYTGRCSRVCRQAIRRQLCADALVLLSLVYSGDAVIALKNGTTLTASDLESLPRSALWKFMNSSTSPSPKDVQLAELVRLYELLELPTA